MLCANWKLFGDSCFPVFRNPDATPQGQDKYLLVSFIGIDPFSTLADLSERTKSPGKAMEVETPSLQLEWTSDADGTGRDGLFIRHNPPSFSFTYPKDFSPTQPVPGNIFKATGASGLQILEISVGKIEGEVRASLSGFAEGYKGFMENSGIGVGSKISYNRPLPELTYGANHPAQEFEIDWQYGGNLPLTTYGQVIAKGEYYIFLIGIEGKGLGDIGRFKTIFKTIRLNP
jgi:hypothetical protein